MNIIKYSCIVLFSVILTGCSVCPWKTIKFISFPIETISEIQNFDTVESDCKIENILLYFVSNGIEDSMYSTKSPYSLNFVFESFEQQTLIINSIRLEFDGKKKILEKDLFPVSLTIDFPNYLNDKLYSGNYKTDYIYELKNVKEIKAILNVTVMNNGNMITKDIVATAERKIKMGLFQYRF